MADNDDPFRRRRKEIGYKPIPTYSIEADIDEAMKSTAADRNLFVKHPLGRKDVDRDKDKDQKLRQKHLKRTRKKSRRDI